MEKEDGESARQAFQPGGSDRDFRRLFLEDLALDRVDCWFRNEQQAQPHPIECSSRQLNELDPN